MLRSWLATAAVIMPQAAVAESREAQVDRLFAAYAKRDGPGCAVAVAEGGKTVYAKGYGMADLTWNVPITPDTIFDVASDAKQFTAFAVALLAQRGKLSLDDDVRRHVPELRDFGTKVTLRHMLEHSSGLPDSVALSRMTGRVGFQQLTAEELLRLASDIPELDFAPGSDWSYSNMNFFLLGLVAERVSGRPMAEFLATEAFGPAGMKRTQYQPDPQLLIPGRAVAYAISKGQLRIVPYPTAEGGSKGVQSTVLDMLAWGRALDSGKLGGIALAMTMQTPRSLSGGEPLTYGMGLDILHYRGARAILHGGTGTGYRSQTMRFPNLDAGVSVLCNRSDADHEGLARSVADVWLSDRLAPKPTPEKLTDTHRAAAGNYINDKGWIIELKVTGDTASAEGLTPSPLYAAGPKAFGYETGYRPARIAIGSDDSLLYTPGQGRPIIYRRYETVTPSPAALAQYAGRYFSPAYGTTVTVEENKGELRLVSPSGTLHRLRPTLADRFLSWPVTALVFDRGADGRIRKLTLSAARAKKVEFEPVR